jgi:AraC-like DNA-binding protein
VVKPLADPGDRGILKAQSGKQKFSLNRYAPAPGLALCVDRIWTVRWDLRGEEPYRQTILSFPNVNLAFERDDRGTQALVYGVPKSTSSHDLHGQGEVLGIKFRPGGFYPILQQPISRLTGRIVQARHYFGERIDELALAIFAAPRDEQRAELAASFLQKRLPQTDAELERVQRIVDAVFHDRELVKVDDLATRFGLSVRSLQRLFSRYVGISPKQVIIRYRLQEAAELMERDSPPDWTSLAHNLGYYDQAHFIKDFKAMIGKPPAGYAKELAGSAN